MSNNAHDGSKTSKFRWFLLGFLFLALLLWQGEKIPAAWNYLLNKNIPQNSQVLRHEAESSVAKKWVRGFEKTANPNATADEVLRNYAVAYAGLKTSRELLDHPENIGCSFSTTPDDNRNVNISVPQTCPVGGATSVIRTPRGKNVDYYYHVSGWKLNGTTVGPAMFRESRSGFYRCGDANQNQERDCTFSGNTLLETIPGGQINFTFQKEIEVKK
jgi:hypothetical protein